MTVSTTTSRVEYAGNGSTTAFSVPFYFLANGDIKVYKAGVLQTLTTHYTVSGAGNPAGGTVTFLSAPANGQAVVILRDPALTQNTDYVPNDPFPAESHERALDRLTMIAQRNRDLIDRAFVLPDGVTGVSTDLPVPEANKVIAWDSNGTALQNRDATDFATALTYADRRVNTFTGNGTTVDFALAETPAVIANTDVDIEGVSQVPGVDYQLLADGVTIRFDVAPPNGQTICVKYGQAVAQSRDDAGTVYYLPAGTGAVSRSVQTKLREFVSAADFGAGTGVADNSAALQAAIDATAPGGRLHIPAGTYAFATGLTRSSAITIVGDGVSGAGGTTLRYTGSSNAFTYSGGGSATGGRFQDFVLEGTASANNGIYLSNAFNNILFDKVYVRDFTKAGANAVYLEDAWDVTFLACSFRGSYNGVKCGIGATYAVVNACRWLGCEWIEISNVGFTLTSGSGNLISGCDFSGQVGQIQIDLAPSLSAGTNHACNGNVIENSYMEGGNVTDLIGIRIGESATISTSLIQGNIIQGVYMDWDGDYIRLYNCLATVIRDPKIGTVQAGKKAIIIDSGATYTKVEWQRRGNITDSATTTQYVTHDLITLTETQGNYTSPNKSMFQARPNGNILNVTGNGTVYTVIFGTELFDTQGEYSTSTGLFTAAKTGKYQFSVGLVLSGMSGATFLNIRLVTSNRSYDIALAGSGVITSGGACAFSGAALADMDAGDTAKITVEVSGIGADSADILANNSFFSGCLIG